MQVKVLSERWQIPLPCESRALQMPPRQPAWIRCVLLQCGHSSLIYARTVIPDLQPDNPWHAIQKLGNQPLGEILFEREAIHRSPFEFAYAPYPSWPDLAGAETQNALNENGFARRSLFLEHQAPLLLTEVFLPAILELETQGR
jgi:chorismate--pyruvate lyase